MPLVGEDEDIVSGKKSSDYSDIGPGQSGGDLFPIPSGCFCPNPGLLSNYQSLIITTKLKKQRNACM